MLALIPARGGSKGIPRKNIRPLCGKPLIVYTIEAAQASRHIDRLVLSTDDAEIASLAKAFGVEVPFMRPDHLAQAHSLAIDNYLYTIEKLNEMNLKKVNEFIVLQPTSPFRTSEDIDRAIDLFYEKKADAVISVCEAPCPPSWLKKVDQEGRLFNYFNLEVCMNRQTSEKVYLLNGAIFILRWSCLKENYTYYSENTFAYLMPQERSLDIDTPLDFEFAEFLMRRYGQS